MLEIQELLFSSKNNSLFDYQININQIIKSKEKEYNNVMEEFNE